MTEDKRELLVEQYMAGVPLKLIGLKVGVTPQRVSVIAIANGCPSRKMAWFARIGQTGSSGLPWMIRQRIKRGWDVEVAINTPPYGRPHA